MVDDVRVYELRGVDFDGTDGDVAVRLIGEWSLRNCFRRLRVVTDYAGFQHIQAHVWGAPWTPEDSECQTNSH